MRTTWRVGLAVVVVLAVLAGAALGSRATAAAALPACKAGQVTTKAHPCTKPSAQTTTATPANFGPPVAVTDPNPATGVPNPDTADQGVHVCGCDASTVMRYLDPRGGRYQLVIFNTSGIGYINSVNWLPPAGMTVTAITAVSGGTCRMDMGDIACDAKAPGLAPPKCTCQTGGVMTVNFTATGDEPVFNGSWWIYHGLVGASMQITSMTPVPYHIPSFIQPPTNKNV
jgi:hypothetical protein